MFRDGNSNFTLAQNAEVGHIHDQHSAATTAAAAATAAAPIHQPVSQPASQQSRRACVVRLIMPPFHPSTWLVVRRSPPQTPQPPTNLPYAARTPPTKITLPHDVDDADTVAAGAPCAAATTAAAALA